MQLHIFIFIIGLCAGSFLNVVIHRLKTGEKIVKSRSHCPRCGHTLGFLDLIPVLSFLFLGGKCRYCRDKISCQYPLVELATGMVFVLIFHRYLSAANGLFFSFEKIVESLFLIIILSLLIVVFVYDLKHYIIPNRIIYPALGVTFAFRIFEFLSRGDKITDWVFLNPLLSAVCAGGFFLGIYLLSRGKWLGFGDVKLVFLMGLMLGFPNIVIAVFSASLIGSVVGSALVFWGKKGWRSEIPFGPFLVTGSFTAFLWGEFIAQTYFNILLGI